LENRNCRQSSVSSDNIRERKLIAIYQASGSGKTKLAYSLALEGYFLCIRFVKDSDYFSLTNAVSQNTRSIRENIDKCKESDISECLLGNFRILRIWTVCWIEVLIEFDRIYHDSKHKYEMFLRFTQNDTAEIRNTLLSERKVLSKSEEDAQRYMKSIMTKAREVNLVGIFYDEPTYLGSLNLAFKKVLLVMF
jgi:hypothetical protein